MGLSSTCGLTFSEQGSNQVEILSHIYVLRYHVVLFRQYCLDFFEYLVRQVEGCQQNICDVRISFLFSD